MNRQQLEACLRESPDVDADHIDVAGNGKLVAKIIVRTFDGVDEAERQKQVYEFLRARFSEDDMQSVEYILTNASGDPPA